MKLLRYELKKTFASSATRLLCLLLLLLHVVLTAVSAQNTANASVPPEALDALIAVYTRDEQAVMQEYEERQRVWKDYQDTIAQMPAEQAASYPPPALTDTYATDDAWTDEDVYLALFDLIEYRNAYQRDITALLRETQAKYQAYLSDGTTNRAAIMEQYRYLAHYHPLSSQVTLPLQAVRGWDTVFFSVFPDILCGLLLILLLSPLFTVERTEHVYAVLRTTKRGRCTLTLVKLCTAFVIALTTALLFSVMTLLTVAASSGLSDPTAPVQLLTRMKYCPWGMSMATFWLFSLGLKTVAFCVLAMIMCGLSAAATRASRALLPGLVLWIGCAAGLFLPEASFWASCNLLSLANAYPVSMRYRGYRLLGLICVDQVTASVCLWGAAAAACVGYFVWVRGLRSYVTGQPNASKLRKGTRSSSRQVARIHSSRCTSRSLFGGEMEKIATSRGCVIVLSLFLLLELGQCVKDCRAELGTSEQEYRRYTTAYAGELTEDTVYSLLQEKQQIAGTMRAYGSMLTMAWEGAISHDAWQAYILEYADAYRRSDAIMRVTEHISALSAQTGGKTPWLLYDTGWQRLFRRSADLTLIVTVVYLSSAVFPTEYRKRASGGAFYPLLRATKRGRLSVLLSKCVVSAVCGGVLAMFSQLLLILPLLVRGEWISPLAPLSSLALLPHSPDMSIVAYLGWCCAVRIVSMMLLAVTVCLASALFKREIFTLLPVSLVLFFPHVLVALDMPKAEYVDFLSLYSCTPMLALHHARVAPIVLYLVLQAALCGVLFVAVYCRTCGTLRIVRNSRMAT